MVNTVIFDFDGTLIDTNDVILASWQHTYRHFLGHDVSVEHITKTFGEPLMKTLAREFPDVPPQESAEVYRTYQRKMAADMVKLFPGVVEMLQTVKDRGYKIGIVTSRTKESTMNYLEMFNIGGFFDGLVSCDDTSIHKPNPEPLLMGLEKLGASAEESIMVGDSIFDIKCANNAGVKSVLVDWRVASDNENLSQCQIDYKITAPLELIKVLEEVK
ncbi:MAG: HAD-IIIA family hydrolase [Firmicutes bacterium]|nr:HAD-IIIA family hydrolase [Bacillota bacterium]